MENKIERLEEILNNCYNKIEELEYRIVDLENYINYLKYINNNIKINSSHSNNPY